ncbi:peroxisomal biogenesis factor 11 [Zychaea mexicana]|uniref:peroxisomal biogenesis factor 11 n=1 Tax=Zychaea mexicana TaxID=64656 RepID=UPI0022FE42FB|nr:peroxisomal biogenesis factor 11 [Zychaea mexicana]KAI9488605.1 peroxisomal biogenesis factor 11 [Zychaea mexicana]
MSLNAQVTSVNNFLGTTTGREKLCRFIQYFARFYAFYLLRQGAPQSSSQRWNDLKQHIGNGRKFFRLFKPIEFVQTAVHSLGSSDEVVRLTAVVKHLSNALYYCSEVFVLTTAIGFYKPKNVDKIQKFGWKCWFISLFASILASLYKFRLLNVKAVMLEKSKRHLEGKRDPELNLQEKQLVKEINSNSYQLVQDVVDIIIPSGNLGWLPVDEGVIGLAGAITSLMAVNTQWKKTRVSK